MSFSPDDILLEIQDGIAIITLNRPNKLNALSLPHYTAVASKLREVDADPSVYCTIVTGKGRFFSSGADVRSVREPAEGNDTSVRTFSLGRFSMGNMDLVDALAKHRPLLVAALNGPAVGLSAGILGWFDFIYSTPDFWLLTPFSSLGLGAEGGSSLTFPIRMGLGKANEALILGKKLGAEELEKVGFINKIFVSTDSDTLLPKVVSHMQETLSELNKESIQTTKRLIRSSLPSPDASNLREIFVGADRFESGDPAIEFAKIANKEKKHKL